VRSAIRKLEVHREWVTQERSLNDICKTERGEDDYFHQVIDKAGGPTEANLGTG